MPIPNPTDLVERYLTTWNEADDARRQALVAQTFTPGARYVDPLVACEGHDGIDATIRAVQAQFPAHRFARVSEPDQHGNALRFSWRLGPAGGAAIAGGTDFAVLDADGRFASVTGFLDPVPAAPSRPRGSTVTTRDGEQLFYRDAGTGAPVVLVHSWALSSQMWQYQTRALADAGLRCITYDRRGHGRSSPATTGYDYDTLADDLGAVLDHLDLHGVTLVGHSMGCGEIVRYLARHGSRRIARVALLAPLTPIVLRTDDNPDGVPRESFEQQWAGWARDFPAWVADNQQAFFVPETSAALIRWMVDELLRTHLEVAIATSRASVTGDLRPDLARIDRPTLILHGDRDASVPLALGQRTADGIAGARLSIYEGAPHGLFVTHAARVNAELLAFIAA